MTRRHIVLDHEKAGGSPNIFSIIGGKLTTYRSLAEETADIICNRLALKVSCPTRQELLPGARMSDKKQQTILELSNKHQVSEDTLDHLTSFYGSRTLEILELIGKSPELATLVSEGRPEIMAEVVYAIKTEHAETLGDLFFRRTSLGSYPDRSMKAINNVAVVAREYLTWSSKQTQRESKDLKALISEENSHESVLA